MKNQVTDAELVTALKLIKKHGSASKAAAASGISQTTLKEWREKAKAKGFTAETALVDEKETLAAKLRLSEIVLRQKDEELADVRKDLERIAELNQRPVERPDWLLKEGTNGFRGTPCTLWSDWHRGELVRSAEVGGVNEFNSDIHDKRVRHLVNTTIDLAFNHMGRATTMYPGCVVALGGDFINGDIHQELVENSDRTTQQNIDELTDILAGALDKMATKFGQLYVPCVVGNHGRATLKPRAKRRVHQSHEWNIYRNLRREFKNTPNIVFEISEETDVWFKVYGHRYLLTHGDSLGVKGGDGIIGAIGPIMRGSIKVGRSEAQIGRDFDTILMGHWHQYLTLPGIIVNNSLKGYDDFARLVLRAPYSRPSQALWFTHPEHGITAHWQVYLEKLRTANDDKHWVSFQEANK